jgi:hypothetical protein
VTLTSYTALFGVESKRDVVLYREVLKHRVELTMVVYYKVTDSVSYSLIFKHFVYHRREILASIQTFDPWNSS